MARTRRYKRFEKNIVQSILAALKAFFLMLGSGIAQIFRSGTRKLTIMVVPHSQQKVINFQTNIFAIIIGFVLFVGIVTSFFILNTKTHTTNAELARLQAENRDTRASLDELRDENNNLLQAAKKFQTSLSQTISILGINKSRSTNSEAVHGSDLASLFNVQEFAQGSVKETADIKMLASYLEGAVEPIEEIGKMLEAQGTLFSDIPSVWPIKGGIGHISMPFGQNIHPITGQWYIHKGMDFSTYRSGDPIIATANGQVVTVAYDSGLGKYVIIKHKHGFYTRYAHMNSTRVQKGQFVAQGEIIGVIGNTGVSTGPHLHYEVHIGSDVVDPAKYVNVTLGK